MLKFTLALLHILGLSLALPSWAADVPSRSKLKKSAEALSNLLHFVMTPHQPAPEERDRVVSSMRSLKAMSHEITSSMTAKSLDPMLRYAPLELAFRWAQMEAVYVHGNYSHARYLLRHTIQTCMSCHVSSSQKAALALPFPKAMPELNDYERAEYFAAIRRAKEAMLAYEEVLTQQQFRNSKAALWENSMVNLMASTILIRNDPHITLEMISKLLETGGLSAEQREMLLVWRSSAKNWTRERLLKNLDSDELIMLSQRLANQGDSLSRHKIKHGFIEYLRAIKTVEKLAANADADRHKTLAFRVAGETSEKLHSYFFWTYPETFYEACIRSSPHSSESAKCWRRFEAFRAQEPFTLWDRELAGHLKELAF